MLKMVSAIAAFVIAAGPAHAERLFDEPLIEAAELAAALGHKDLAIIDIRNRIDGGSQEVFDQAHIPGSVYSNYLEAGWRVEEDGVVGVIPAVQALEALVGSLGVDNDDHVVLVYGGKNATDFGSAARIYWTLKFLGHDQVSILNGGFREWQRDPERPIATGSVVPEAASFSAEPRSELLIATDEVQQTLQNDGYMRVDARPYGQHVGQSKAPMAARHGRIPDSVGLENALFVDPETGKVRSAKALRAIVPAEIVTGDHTIISYCNTGHWASVNWFVMSELLGYDNVRLYDASIAGWSLDPDREMNVGEQLLNTLSRWVDQG